jgi:hypothetical protein
MRLSKNDIELIRRALVNRICSLREVQTNLKQGFYYSCQDGDKVEIELFKTERDKRFTELQELIDKATKLMERFNSEAEKGEEEK